MAGSTAFFTIVSKNYISYARVLMESIAKFHPDASLFLLLADNNDGYLDAADENFELIEASELEIKDFESFTFKYSIVEFNTAIKPYCFSLLFQKYSFDKVIYLDPDIVVFNEQSEVLEALEDNAVVVTPHILSPIPDDGHSPVDIDIKKAGIFNLGFIGLSRCDETTMFLSWWMDRLYDKCLVAPLFGYALDQGWVSLVPAIIKDYHVVRDPAYNIAYWNFHERKLDERDGEYSVNGNPLRFFHFSGFLPLTPEFISKYQSRFTFKGRPDLHNIFKWYASALSEKGYRETYKWPYAFGTYSTGEKIPNYIRSIYWGLNKGTETFGGSPFEGIWLKLLHPGNFRRVFTLRFVRILLDVFLRYSVDVVRKIG